MHLCVTRSNIPRIYVYMCVTRSNIPRIYVYMCLTRSNNPRILYNVYVYLCVTTVYCMSNIPRIYHILYVYLFVPGSTIPKSLCSDLSTHYRMIEDTPVQLGQLFLEVCVQTSAHITE